MPIYTLKGHKDTGEYNLMVCFVFNFKTFSYNPPTFFSRFWLCLLVETFLGHLSYVNFLL